MATIQTVASLEPGPGVNLFRVSAVLSSASDVETLHLSERFRHSEARKARKAYSNKQAQ
jgi:hypothetical protein